MDRVISHGILTFVGTLDLNMFAEKHGNFNFADIYIFG
jgi:hypothetical protein